MRTRGQVARQLMTAPWVHPKTGLLWYRKVIPPRARHLFDGKGEVRRSLGTRDPREARVRHARIAAEVEARIAAASRPPHGLSHRELVALAGEWYRRKLAEGEPDPGPARDWGFVVDAFREDLEGYTRQARQRWRELVGAAPADAEDEDETAPAAWTALAPELPDNFRAILREVDALAGAAGHHLDADTRDRLYGLTLRNALRLFARLEVRANGDYSPDPHLPTFPALTVRTPDPASARPRAAPKVRFTELIAGWAAERWPGEKTRYTVQVRAGLLAAFLGHDDAARVTADDLRGWRQALLAEGRAASTADNYLSDVKILFRWAADSGTLPANPTAGLRLGAAKRKAGERRLPFNDAEARLILEAARRLRGADRWIPWLLAFTGARVEEVAQALVADVREWDGVAYLDINAEGEEKSLKNVGSARKVPLHPALIAEGFLGYVAGLPRSGRLFPDLAPGPFGDRSAAYSKRAGRWLRGLGIADRRKVANHSWRHRFKDVCRDAGVARDVHDRLTGHAEGGVSGGYGSGHGLLTLATAVRKLPLPPGLVVLGYPELEAARAPG
jgi:integrase